MLEALGMEGAVGAAAAGAERSLTSLGASSSDDELPLSLLDALI